MEYNLITTKKINVETINVMSKKDFEVELKLYDDEFYVIIDEEIMHVIGTTFYSEPELLEGYISILNRTFNKYLKDLTFSFDLKRFYKIEQ